MSTHGPLLALLEVENMHPVQVRERRDGSVRLRGYETHGGDPRGSAVVGMAALFTAVVRAPITGIILAIELTGSFTLLLPMLAACFAAMLVPTLLQNPPIYESLRWDSRDD